MTSNMNRRTFLQGVSVASLTSMLPAAALAAPLAAPSTLSKTTAGKSLIGGFDANGQSFAFINFFKLGSGQTAGSFAFPGVLDANGYPNKGAVTTAIGTTVFLYPGVGTGNWCLTWTGTGAIQLNPGAPIKVVSSKNATISGNLSYNMTVAGTDPYVVFSFTNGTPSNLAVYFPAGKTYGNMASAALYRQDQESLFNAGQVFNPDFISLVKSLNPKVLRLMDWSHVNNALVSQFAYRAPATAFSYQNPRWIPSAWVGSISSAGDAYTCAAPSDWKGLVGGTTIQGQFANATPVLPVSGAANNGSGAVRLALGSTATLRTGQTVGFSSSGGVGNGGGIWKITVVDQYHVDLQGSTFTRNVTGSLTAATLNVAGFGPKLICGSGGAAVVAAGAMATFVYDAILDVWLLKLGGMLTGVPVEFQVALCNQLGVAYWSNLHTHYTDESVKAHISYVRDNLQAGLTCYYEHSNEVWNPGFVQYNWAKMRGRAFGFSTANARQEYGAYGLRVRQIMGMVTTLYGAKKNFKRVMAIQAYGSTVNTQAYRFNGADLSSIASLPYKSLIGADYNAAPNRPIDYCDVLSYATYYSGAQLTGGAYDPVGSYGGLLAAADGYATGDSEKVASALAFVDSDIRAGTRVGYGPNQTLAGLNALIYPAWEAIAASYDAPRAAQGLQPLTVECYEGGCECAAPTIAQCVTLGIDPTYSTKIASLLAAYKSSPVFKQLVLDQYTQFMSKPHSKTPAWFALQGASQWSIMKSNTYSDKFQSWDANVAYNK